jgi:hypothetical protein
MTPFAFHTKIAEVEGVNLLVPPLRISTFERKVTNFPSLLI